MGDLKPSEDIAQRLNRVRVAWPVNRSLSSHEQDQALYAIIAYLDERHEATAGLPQAPADGGEPGFARCTDCGGQAIYCRCAVEQQRDKLVEQVAALTAERDGLGRQLMAEIEAKLFNIKEVVKWTGLATEHRKELHATRAELRQASAVVEVGHALHDWYQLNDHQVPASGHELFGKLTFALDALTLPIAWPTD